MAERSNQDRDDARDDMPRGESDEQIRSVANDDDEFEDTEDVDEEEDEEEGSF